MEIAQDRRSAMRVAVPANVARVRWWGTGRDSEVEAHFVDLSLSGALIACDNRESDRRLWLRLREPGRSEWVAARVARETGAGLVAVAFDRPCPDELLWSAMLGVGFGNLLHDGGADHEDGRSSDDWMF
jgi:hypothetical protein